MSRKMIFTAALAALALVAAGCGDDKEDTTTEEAAATPQQAIAEIGAVRQGLAQGLAAYQAGDAQRADMVIGDAYLEHFEIVEGPLDEVDPELNEELEELISTETRDAIKAGAPAKEVEALVQEAQRGLDQAEAALGKA
ncbi:MAG: hypothetical protein ACRDKH_02310 [Solirubrobacterales bacterium]